MIDKDYDIFYLFIIYYLTYSEMTKIYFINEILFKIVIVTFLNILLVDLYYDI